MRLIVQYGVYQCAGCQMAVQFEADPSHRWGSCLRRDNSAIGACVNSRCTENGKRLRLVLPTIEVEEAPRLAEYGDIYPIESLKSCS